MSYVLLNNQITERKNVKIDIEDRGYNFGDGIYEVMPIYNKQVFTMEEHLQRFEECAAKLEIKMPFDKATIANLLNELKTKNEITEGIVYIQMTRGVSPRAHLYERNVEGLITAFSRQMVFPKEQQQKGIRVYVTEDIRWLRCDIKTINLLGNTMVKREATDNDCKEAVMHRNGTVTEGSSSNLFIVKNGTIHTHPATNLILNGITRQTVIKLAEQNGYNIVEEAFSLEQLKNADEAFITSTTQEITPIIQAIGEINGTYSIGKLTKMLQNEFTQYVKKCINNK
ncbi:D-amino-acid transaminase [Anaerobacillus arseniciselenatis]|uniref:D-alanine aminotransferase n=1 Tax=Anaerobacillus arseniciselenatis TaxID=85682 RepID=A0A1S2LU45_9BACI|nr:D-amino-acid transaminase [Anaerobacillus arseniciselenatis]OIJ16052.1 D-amino-acid transaminase [Anaerobacillus arseniciselenatis]